MTFENKLPAYSLDQRITLDLSIPVETVPELVVETTMPDRQVKRDQGYKAMTHDQLIDALKDRGLLPPDARADEDHHIEYNIYVSADGTCGFKSAEPFLKASYADRALFFHREDQRGNCYGCSMMMAANGPIPVINIKIEQCLTRKYLTGQE